MVVWLHLVPDRCMPLSVSRKMEEEFEEEFEEDFLKGLEDTDWDADWDEIEELCGGDDSLCCIKKGNISDSEEAQVKTTCFAKHVDDDQICKAISERIPRNTIKSTNWGNSVFEAWFFERDIDKKAVDMTDGELNKYISWFVHEAVKQDGCSPYPPNSLYQIVVAIQRHLTESGHPEDLK